ncbi:hypothetical protein ABC255_08870 [Neobacillus sp. 3P2-tot-E-2]|uniref:hypothetical protein n=1 Tax=Neobacillus sp. 3P2-tot-E-2 TaxID=3132212 RepID=UPI0039A0748B
MNITFNTKNLVPQQQDSIISFLEAQLPALNLELSSLNEIIITENFFDDILTFQIKHNKRERGATKNSNGEAIAKVIDYIDKKGEFRQVVFLSDWIANGLFLEEPEQVNYCFHFIHHELVHVHDEFQKKRIYSERLRKGTNEHVLDHMLRVHADVTWSEYIAERLSFTSITTDHISTLIDYVEQLMNTVQKNINEEISQYRFHGNIDSLYKILQEETSLLLKVSANLIGVIQGITSVTKGSPNIKNKIDEIFTDSYFFQTWNLLNEALYNLMKSYPNWNDIYGLDPLGKVILECWNSLGIFPTKSGHQMYIDVP